MRMIGLPNCEHMKLPLLELLPNRIRRNYAGGRILDSWENLSVPQDGNRPEDWSASTTPAHNPGMPVIPNEGIGRVRDDGGGVHLLSHLFRKHGEYLQKPGHGAQLNRSKSHTLTGAWRTPKPG